MKTESAKARFPWTAFSMVAISYIICTLLTTKLIDDLPWKDAFSIKNILKEFIGAIFFAFTFYLILRPSLKKKT